MIRVIWDCIRGGQMCITAANQIASFIERILPWSTMKKSQLILHQEFAQVYKDCPLGTKGACLERYSNLLTELKKE